MPRAGGTGPERFERARKDVARRRRRHDDDAGNVSGNASDAEFKRRDAKVVAGKT